VAVSGGIDSVCLLDILHKLKYKIGVAHMNHQLRSNESDLDEIFVKDQCSHYNIDCHIKKVDIRSISKMEKKNISDVGRRERYRFFSALTQTFDYTHIATAHHADDDIETFIMRSMDGSGLTGLSGIPVKNGNIVRPLLNMTRSEIELYVHQEKLAYREDSSNKSLKYVRNAVRKIIIPAIVEIKPSSKKGIKHSINIIKDSNKLLSILIKKEIEHRTKTIDRDYIIDLTDLDSAGKMTFIFHAIKPFGFNRSQTIDILKLSESGKYFHSKTHSLLFNRNQLIISDLKKDNQRVESFSVYDLGSIQVGEKSSLIIEHVKASSFNTNPREELIDANKIIFPLNIRKWKSGDSFKPFGMNGQSQTLQDFFTNQKLSRIEKEKVWLLESNNEIIWVIGHRISDSVKIDNSTKDFIKLKFIHQ